MRIVYFGSSQFGLPSLQALMDSGKALVHIVTQPPHAAGRGRKPRPTPVARWAAEHGLPCTETDDVNAPGMIERLAAERADLLVVIAFGQKIAPAVLKLFGKGAINVHASLLPEYRGAAPIHRAIIDGKTETGISIITVADKMDAGDILAQARCPIGPNDTAESLHKKLAALAPLPLLETVDRIAAGTAVYTSQDPARVSFAPKLKKSDGFIDFAEPAEVLARKVRGLWSWPGAQAMFVSTATGRRERVTFARTEPLAVADPAHHRAADPAHHAEPDTAGIPNAPADCGTLDAGLNVVCGRGRLRILALKPAGKTVMDFDAFVRGRCVSPGDRFETLGEPNR